jgi:L-alanine-DL-glutamate epimerase-like enolase superfamily enzyme
MTGQWTESTLTGSTWTLVAALPVEIDCYAITPLAQPVSPAFTRRTTMIHLQGRGEDGIGEDLTPTELDQLAFQHAELSLPLVGDWTLASFSAHLETLDPFPVTVPHSSLRTFRRWAFESAALDLALRQAGRSLADVLGKTTRPVTFVNSLRLPDPPTIEPIRRRLELVPGLRFKLDPTSAWNDRLLADLAATGAVDTLDFKGLYPPQAPIAQPADPDLYERVADAFPDCWLEDPALTPATEEVLRPHRDRITWDFPIRTIADIEALPYPPRALNIKPSRIGTLHGLLELYDHCARLGIETYGGGMGELGAGRTQIQLLAALFHPSAPNDVAPAAYNAPQLADGLPASPLPPPQPRTGFR